VTEPVASSTQLLEHLEGQGLPVDAAFWLLDPESRIWYLYIASPLVAQQGAKHAYEVALEALLATGSEIPLAQLKMISPNASVVRHLRSAFRVDGFSWVTLRHTTINGTFLEDAVLLRT
jgi:hypothetical protein